MREVSDMSIVLLAWLRTLNAVFGLGYKEMVVGRSGEELFVVWSEWCVSKQYFI
jgi:hypothetical protein